MRKLVCLYLTSALICVATSVYAQGQTTPVPTVPNLSSRDWSPKPPIEDYVGRPGAQVLCKIKVYSNATEQTVAVVFEYKGSEFLMLYARDNGTNVRAALKVDGVWHVAKEYGEDKLKDTTVLGTDGKPAAVKLTLDTVNGPKEVVLPLK